MMAIADRGQVAWKPRQGSTDRTREWLAGILLGALLVTVGLRSVLPIDALAPVIATMLFALGAAMAGFALLRRQRARWIDIAGFLTFAGVVISILIEPDQLVRLLSLSAQPD